MYCSVHTLTYVCLHTSTYVRMYVRYRFTYIPAQYVRLHMYVYICLLTYVRYLPLWQVSLLLALALQYYLLLQNLARQAILYYHTNRAICASIGSNTAAPP